MLQTIVNVILFFFATFTALRLTRYFTVLYQSSLKKKHKMLILQLIKRVIKSFTFAIPHQCIRHFDLSFNIERISSSSSFVIIQNICINIWQVFQDKYCFVQIGQATENRDLIRIISNINDGLFNELVNGFQLLFQQKLSIIDV